MKKIFILLLIIFIPNFIYAEEIDDTYLKKDECDKVVDLTDVKKNILFEKENKDEILLQQNPDLLVEESFKYKNIDDDKLKIISFRNIKLKDKIKFYVKLKELKIYVNGQETQYNTFHCENCENEGAWISRKCDLYLYQKSSFNIVSYKSFDVEEIKISLDFDTNDIIEEFELVFLNEKKEDIYKKVFNNDINFNDLNIVDNYTYTNKVAIPNFIYYENLYKCYNPIQEKNNNIPLLKTKNTTQEKTIVNNSKEEAKLLEKNLNLLNYVEKKNKKLPTFYKEDFSNKGIKSKFYYIKNNNKFLLYYLITLPFLIILFIIFVKNAKKCRTKKL